MLRYVLRNESSPGYFRDSGCQDDLALMSRVVVRPRLGFQRAMSHQADKLSLLCILGLTKTRLLWFQVEETSVGLVAEQVDLDFSEPKWTKSNYIMFHGNQKARLDKEFKKAIQVKEERP